MPEREDLRVALEDLRSAAIPLITAPGVERVRRTVARRRSARVALVASILGLLAAAAFVVPGRTRPVPPVYPTPSASATPEPTPSSWATSTPSPAPPPSSSSGPVAGGPGSGGCQPKGAPVPYGNDEVTDWLARNPPYRGPFDICPGETIRVFVATYEFLPDGSQRLYDFDQAVVTYENFRARTVVKIAPCSGDRYWVSGNFAVVQTIAKGKHNAYPDHSVTLRGGVLQHFSGTPCPQPTVTPTP